MAKLLKSKNSATPRKNRRAQWNPPSHLFPTNTQSPFYSLLRTQRTPQNQLIEIGNQSKNQSFTGSKAKIFVEARPKCWEKCTPRASGGSFVPKNNVTGFHNLPN